MAGALESRNKNKYCDFHGDKGHNTDDCLHLKRQIEEAVKSEKLAHLVKEIKQGSNKASTSKTVKKAVVAPKDKGAAIIMVQSWGRNVRPRTNPLASILGKVPIPSYGVDELSSSKIAFTIQRNSKKAENTCAGSSSIYRPWHDKISNKSKGCHNQNEKSQVAIHPEYLE
ncbi:hypothetical protein Tco_1174852 [Tanacetum coccineum]